MQQIFQRGVDITKLSASPSGSPAFPTPASMQATRPLKQFSTGDIKILLLENVNQTAVNIFTARGYQIERHKGALSKEELIEKIKDIHAIGIRSKTKLTADILQHAKNLVCIGCFCIGTNQVDLDYAAKRGIAVFNSPFSNSRSVAELAIAEIISLARQLCDRSMELHHGTWNKVSSNAFEVRGKTLGIIGYGHIGSQLSVLAEAMGMQVIYYDIVQIMTMGTARQVNTLEELLASSDFITLHVPETPDTKLMISRKQFAAMRDGTYFINLSRGSVVNIPDLIEAIKSGKIAGTALDVYPNEPAKNGSETFTDKLNDWTSELVKLPNVILSPHIGGSTEEAQRAIGTEVGSVLSKYIDEGSSVGAVNFPEVTLKPLDPTQENTLRVLYIHKNVPGVLKIVNDILSTHNIEKQFSDSRGEIAYLMADISSVDKNDIRDIYDKLNATEAKIAIRLLY